MTNDLKLLVDIAWANRHGQVGYRPKKGEMAAANRLTSRGMLMVSNGREFGISKIGDHILERLSKVVDGCPICKGVAFHGYGCRNYYEVGNDGAVK